MVPGFVVVSRAGRDEARMGSFPSQAYTQLRPQLARLLWLIMQLQCGNLHTTCMRVLGWSYVDLKQH